VSDETMALVSEQFDTLAERLAEVRLKLAREIVEMAQRVQALETQVEHLTALSGPTPPPPVG